ncbi:cold shock domain-containing protein [Endozoicomonas sp. SESOKO1]|uniref:cold-shock protein n=1 Tax=Endozoicomonas sp. SESOKO1 TaxID=2828742 RepID=UPI002147E0F8
MRGEVVSYVSDKRYGFINGGDGESYFFHSSNLMDQSEESQLIRGAVVEFDTVPPPKGLAAKSISVQPAIMAPQMTGFIMTRSGQPKYGDVIIEVPIKTRFFKDPNEGRQHLKALAGAIGGNAILNLNVIKRTFSSGNYRYSMHSFQANIALVYELVNVSSEAKQRLLEEDFEYNIRVFNERAPGVIAEELDACKRQTAGVSPRAFFAAVFVAFVMFVFFA